MHIELGKYVPISGKVKFFSTKTACLQKKAVFEKFCAWSKLLKLPIDYKVLRL